MRLVSWFATVVGFMILLGTLILMATGSDIDKYRAIGPALLLAAGVLGLSRNSE